MLLNRSNSRPNCCGECNQFIFYRNLCGESSTIIITAGCKLLDNVNDYSRKEGDEIVSSIFKDCPIHSERG